MVRTAPDTTQIGRTRPQITRVDVGVWAIGGGGWAFGWGPQQDNQSIAAIHRALEQGVNWIDTAYGFGHSEHVVGRALDGLGERPYVISDPATPRLAAPVAQQFRRLASIHAARTIPAPGRSATTRFCAQDAGKRDLLWPPPPSWGTRRWSPVSNGASAPPRSRIRTGAVRVTTEQRALAVLGIHRVARSRASSRSRLRAGRRVAGALAGARPALTSARAAKLRAASGC
jgi:Aldo/keto reductase family